MAPGRVLQRIRLVDHWFSGGYLFWVLRVRVLAILLALSILPATMEVVEAVVHFAAHGEIGHDEHTPALGADEHGCNGTFHLCGCHTASSVHPAMTESPTVVGTIAFMTCTDPVDVAGLGATAPPIRPPIA
jgi:hypothetical protein